jgi:flavin reductase (DIM6/NTAB) family NADH-FMN oxidoreductase RutF
MTVGWGGIGVMWSKPITTVVVRPSRYTYEFMEKYDSFTLSVLPESWRKALQICGTISGRDSNKIQLAGLTPISSASVQAPGFDEAELIIECRKIYADPFRTETFISPEIMKHYPEGDLHVMYFGEIVAVHGTREYRMDLTEGEN